MPQDKNGIKIVLSPQKSEEFFHSALCNGISELGFAGLELSWRVIDYRKAKKSLEAKKEKGEFPKKDTICHEDVLMEILQIGGQLTIIDHENAGKYTKKVGLSDVRDRVQNTPFKWLSQMINEEDDATTAFEVIQQVFFKESVF